MRLWGCKGIAGGARGVVPRVLCAQFLEAEDGGEKPGNEAQGFSTGFYREANDAAPCATGEIPRCRSTPRGFGLLEGMIRRPHQRPRLHVPEAHLEPDALELRELIGMHIALDGKMLAGRLQVLAQRED